MALNRPALEFFGYGGPIVLMTHYCGALILSDPLSQRSLCATLFCIHFAKRVVEVLFVHVWNKNTLPWADGIQELAYYLGFGAWISRTVAQLNADDDGKSRNDDNNIPWLAVCSMLLCITGNGCVHWQLRRHRPLRSKTWPKGIFFDFFNVSCPNYMFEIGTWISFAALTGWQYSSVAFCLVGSFIILDWGKIRHAAYQKQFLNYPKTRCAVIPFLY